MVYKPTKGIKLKIATRFSDFQSALITLVRLISIIKLQFIEQKILNGYDRKKIFKNAHSKKFCKKRSQIQTKEIEF